MASEDLPDWARELITLYESHASNQFILHGNVHDRFLLPLGVRRTLGGLDEFLEKILLPSFDVVLSYDVGNGLRIEKGNKIFAKWPTAKDGLPPIRHPKEGIARITHYLRYCANLRSMGHKSPQVAIILRSAHLVIPATQGSTNYDLSAMASLVGTGPRRPPWLKTRSPPS